MFVEDKAVGEALLPTRLSRLERLYDLAKRARTDRQRDYCTCLWHDAISDPVFLAAGLKPTTTPDSAEFNAAEFFGIDGRLGRVGDVMLWGPDSMPAKRAALRHLIAEERARWGG